MGLPQNPRIHGDRRGGGARAQLLDRIRGEFKEMPCLRLTCRQAQRLFGMRADISERVLATLIGEGLLTCGPDARYGLRADLTWRVCPSREPGQKGPASRAS
jgi:hypothetical protein